MKKFLFLLLILLPGSFVSAGDSKKLQWLEGSWFGTGYQPNALTEQVWTIQVNYSQQLKRINVSYSTFPCNGYWEVVKEEKERAEFIERIENGTDKCANNVKVIITKVDATHISVTYYNGNVVEAFGILEKEK